MADFFKIAYMPRVIGAVDGSLIPIRAPYNNKHMYVCHKGFHTIDAMAVCNAKLSFTLYADGRDLFMIQQFSTTVCSMNTLKMAVDKMAGYLRIVAMGSSHIYLPLSDLIMYPPHLKGDIKTLTQKQETPSRGPLEVQISMP